MAVIDHDVHEKVKIAADKPYLCNSRNPMAKGYYAPDRKYRPDGTFYIVQVWIQNAMSTDCRSFYLWDTDQRCNNCTTKRDTEYADTMKGLL